MLKMKFWLQKKGGGGRLRHVELDFRPALGQHLLAVLIDKGDLDDMLALVPGAKEEPEGD